MSAPALDDISAWEASADGWFSGPAGCWDVQGTARWRHDLGYKGVVEGEAPFAGRLVDGVWELPSTGPFSPMFGKVRGLRVQVERRELVVTRSKDVRVEAVNTVDDVLDQLAGDVRTIWTLPDGQDVALVRATTAGRSDAPLTTTVSFVGGQVGDWRLVLGGPYVHKWLVRVVALDVRLHVTPGDAHPAYESTTFELHLPLWRIRADQTLTYDAVAACPAP